jgi:hypothetical protein
MGAIAHVTYCGGRVLAVRPVEPEDEPDDELEPEALDPLEPLDVEPPEDADPPRDPLELSSRDALPELLDELVDRV